MKTFILFLFFFLTFLFKGYSQNTNNSNDGKRVGITKPRIGKITPATFDVIIDGKVFETVEYKYRDSAINAYKVIKYVEIGGDRWELEIEKISYDFYTRLYLNSKSIVLKKDHIDDKIREGLNFRNYVFIEFLQRYYIISAEN
jgi:hypothetical protein